MPHTEAELDAILAQYKDMRDRVISDAIDASAWEKVLHAGSTYTLPAADDPEGTVYMLTGTDGVLVARCAILSSEVLDAKTLRRTPKILPWFDPHSLRVVTDVTVRGIKIQLGDKPN